MVSADLETERKKRKSGPPRPIKQPAETGKGLLGTGGNALSAVKKLSMPSSLRSRMEGSFNADLSGVRLYESPSVEHHGFEAVAQGSTIGFAPGRFRPETASGRSVIGHEVSHVVSQARGESSGAGGRLLHSSMLEHRADAQGTRAASGLSVGGERIHVGAGNSANAPAQGIITKSDKMKIVNKAPFVREGVWKRGLDDMFVLRVKLVDEAEKAPTGSSPAPSRHKSKKTSARDRLDTAMDAIDPIGSGSTSVSSAIDAVRKGASSASYFKGLGDTVGVVGSGVGIVTDAYDLFKDPSWQGVVSLCSNSVKFLTGIHNVVGDVKDVISGTGISEVTGIGKLVPGLQAVAGVADIAIGIGDMVEQGIAREKAKKFISIMQTKSIAAGIDLENPKAAINKSLLDLRYDADETSAVAGKMKSALFHVGKRFNIDTTSDAAVGTKYRELKNALATAGGNVESSQKDYSKKNQTFREASAATLTSKNQRSAYQAERDKLRTMEQIREERAKAVAEAQTKVSRNRNALTASKKRKDTVSAAFKTEGIDLDAVAKDKRQEFHPMAKLLSIYEQRKTAEESKIGGTSSLSGIVGAGLKGANLGLTGSEGSDKTSFEALMPSFSGIMGFYVTSESKDEDVWSFYEGFEARESGLARAEAQLRNAQKSLAAQEKIISSHTTTTEAMPHKSDTEHEALENDEKAKGSESQSSQKKMLAALEAYKQPKADFEFFKSSFEQGYPGGINDSNADKMVDTKNRAETAAKGKRTSYDNAMKAAPLAFEKFASSIRMGDLMKKKAGQEMFNAGIDILKGILDVAAGACDVAGVAAWVGACISAFSAGLSVAKMIAKHVQKRSRIRMNLGQTLQARQKYLTSALSSSSESVDSTSMTDEEKKAEKEKLQANAGFSHLGRFGGRSDELVKIDEIVQDIIDEAYTAAHAQEIEKAKKERKTDKEIAKIAHVTRDGKRSHGRDTTRLFKRLICFEMGSPKGQRAELSDISIYRNAANMLVDASKEAHTPGAVKNWRDAMKANKKQTAVTRPDPAAMGGIQTLIDLGVIKNLWDPLPTLKDVAQKMGAERRDYRNLIKNPSIRVFPELVQWRADVGAKFGHFDETDEEVAAHKEQFLSGYGRDLGGTGRGAYAQQHMRSMGARRLAGDMFGDRNAVV
ncbi:MAG TPA: DUF4157 domain-containing protein [Oscillospiraceae bacterium]|nr:DUF4157 domain-containing protein [Oscillospiraceae bacterium]HRW56236.1 DUF4157 domain-containing protein [Oscillospiraceae bacterium]